MNGVIHPGSLRVTINVGFISPSGWSPWLTLVSYYGWRVVCLAVDNPPTTKTLYGIRAVSLYQVTPRWLPGSGLSLLLSYLRLFPLGKQLWTDASSLQVAVGCHPRRRSGKPSNEWTITILPCNHVLCGGVYAVFGKLHIVTHTLEGWDTAWSFPRPPRRRLSLILSAIMGGCPYKALHEAYCPPGAESLTSTIWHDGGLLLIFGLTTSVATPDCKSLSDWSNVASHLLSCLPHMTCLLMSKFT
jgi:hypothetical protein